MANLYGVANGWQAASQLNLIGAADINCPAGTRTNLVSFPFLVGDSGSYYPLLFCGLTFTCGATPPTSITIGYHINAGSDVMAAFVPAFMLVASANLFFQITLAGTPLVDFWNQTPTNTVYVSALAAGQTVTARYASTVVTALMARGPDQ